MKNASTKNFMRYSDEISAKFMEQNYYIETLRAAEFHWFFDQGVEAIRRGYYLPGVCCLLNGIEASLRVTIAQVSQHSNRQSSYELSSRQVMNNELILKAYKIGLPVQVLAFPGEIDFVTKLRIEKPKRVPVELVRLRNNICHGNVLDFINKENGPEQSFFTPECLRPLASTLVDVCHVWAGELGKFRSSQNWDNSKGL